MNNYFTSKNALSLFFIFSIFFLSTLQAEFLSFKAGDQVSYIITQKSTGTFKFFDDQESREPERINVHSDATIHLDVKILSTDENGSKYPFDVEITPKKIVITELQLDGLSTRIICYDSENKELMPFERLENYFNKIINQPLIFRIEESFQVKEIKSQLTEANKDFDSTSFIGLFGATPWTYEFFLTQLFHLSGENLKVKNQYPVSFHELINWEDEFIEKEKIITDGSFNYKVASINSNEIEASLKGSSEATSDEYKIDSEIFLDGNVIWSTESPLIQKRHLSIKIKFNQKEFFQTDVDLDIEQTWEPIY